MSVRINMNQAATSATKPKEVVDALTAYLTANSHQSAGRGSDDLATMQTIFKSRRALAELFGAPSPTHVIFTSGATESLNMAIGGLVTEGCHVLATSLEHNAVARPLQLLQEQGRIEVTWLACDVGGRFDPQEIRKSIRRNTRLLVMTHSSNVLGCILPVRESFALAKEYDLLTIVDTAQTAGHMQIQMDSNTDVIAFTGHKGLRGVAGIGGLILSHYAADNIRVWKAGGTGSHSHSLAMPDFLPDKLEPGVPNLLGIISLLAATQALDRIGLDAVRRHEKEITSRFVKGVKQLDLVSYGEYDAENWMPVVSLNVPGLDAGILARKLAEEYGIETRSGLHCSPLAHKSIQTFPQGTLRFSFGADTTTQEVEYALEALASIQASALK